MILTESLKTSLCHYFISRAHIVMWLHYWFQGKRFMYGLTNCISSPPWSTLDSFTWIWARLLLSYFWVMPALLTYAWITSLHLHRPGAIQHLSIWQCTKKAVPGRQTSHAGSALPFAHLPLLFHQENKIAFLSCPQAMTSVCLCLSQQDISPKSQFP